MEDFKEEPEDLRRRVEKLEYELWLSEKKKEQSIGNWIWWGFLALIVLGLFL